MAMTASQLGAIFKGYVETDDLRSVVAKYRGNVEKSVDGLMRLIPKEKRTLELTEKLWSRLKVYWRVRYEGVAVQELPSSSITVAQLGTLRKYQCIRVSKLTEPKPGKMWVRHSKGWSCATRKGEVYIKKLTKPYALVDIEREIKELTAEKKSKPKKESKKTVPKEKKGKKGGDERYFEDDPFTQAAKRNSSAGKVQSGRTSTASAAFANIEDFLGEDTPQNGAPKRSVRSTRNPRKTPAKGPSQLKGDALFQAFENPTISNIQMNNPQATTSIDLLSQAMEDVSSPQSKSERKGQVDVFSAPSTDAKKEDGNWLGSNLLNMEDLTLEPKKQQKKRVTLSQLQGEQIDLGRQ